MYCPRCGQEKNSGDLRFCSRCGLPLGLVTEFVANGGTLPQLAELNKNNKLLTRNNGIKFSLVWFLVLTFLLTPILAIAGGEDIVAFTAVLGFIGGLILILASFLFLKNEPKWAANENFLQAANVQPQRNFQSAPQNAALPPQQTQAAREYAAPANNWRAPDTGELVQPGSVTEETTKLLSKEK